jgi:hypothetical protein
MSLNDGKEIVDDKMSDTKEGKKDCKCPEYVLRAQKNYYGKNKNKPEFLERRRELAKKHREENYEMLLERDRIRMRNKRAAAKANKEKIEKKPVDDSKTENSNSVDIDSELITNIEKTMIE